MARPGVAVLQPGNLLTRHASGYKTRSREMIADSADIRFECSKCGQHLVVEAAGAGLTADCPICNTSMTVPRPGAKREGSSEARGRAGSSTVAAPEPVRPAYADPVPEELREELIDASLINGKLVRDLQKAREENARLQQQLKALGEKCEHLNTSSTHTQAELKTFQTERKQAKAELSALRQKWTAAEETLAARDAELQDLKAKADAAQAEAKQIAARRESEAKAAEAAARQSQKQLAAFESKAIELNRALAEERAQRKQIVAERDGKHRELGDVQTQLSKRSDELSKAQSRLGELEATLAATVEKTGRLTAERGDLELQLKEAHATLAISGDLKEMLARSRADFGAQSEKLRLAEEANQALTARCEQMRREGDSLRRDLADSHDGRELVETRSRLDEATAERDRVSARLSAVEADLRAFTGTEATMRTELDQARADRDDALERVDSLRETRTAKDNQVLRGIIARLNADLAQRAAEVVRLKRARYGLKIAYVVFAIGFLAVLVFAIMVLPRAFQQ